MIKNLVTPRAKAQIATMLALQNSFNSVVFPDWASRKLGWHRAIYVEAGEYLEHLGTWKWWKKGTPDFPQANMELVDIWHFALSWYIDNTAVNGQPVPLQRIAPYIYNEAQMAAIAATEIALDSPDVVEARHRAVDALVREAGAGEFNILAFVKLLAYSGMDFEVLYQRYVGKNALNRFRQTNGYKQGTYVKEWAGEEDNKHLDDILLMLPADEALMDNVLAQLEDRYSRLVRNAA